MTSKKGANSNGAIRDNDPLSLIISMSSCVILTVIFGVKRPEILSVIWHDVREPPRPRQLELG
jgi:hypothetical protein